MKIFEKTQAIILRQQGYSLKEISEKLNVGKSTVSLWVRNLSLSPKARAVLSKKLTLGQTMSQNAHRRITLEKEKMARNFAESVIRKYVRKKYFDIILCSLIYSCEGTKSLYEPISFTNSDLLLLKTFLKLFRLSFNVDEKKFRVCLHLHNYHNKAKQ